MKKLFIILLLLPCFSWATTYYVSPSGSDANDGLSIITPFRNWQKLQDVLGAGDIAYLRGGTYVPTTSTATSIHCWWNTLQGTSGSHITITNYIGEYPVYDFTGFVTVATDPFILYLTDCDYMDLSNFTVKGLAQVTSGAGVSRGIAIDGGSSNNTFTNITVSNMGGGGFVFGNDSNNNYLLNCDSYLNSDPFSAPAYGGADGYTIAGGVNATNIIFENCRAWLNSDDGWDNFDVDGIFTYINCWAFWNGWAVNSSGGFITGGNGEGFKLGPTDTNKATDTLRYLYNCLAFQNRVTGFGQNAAQCLYKIYNCTSYNNGLNGYWMGWSFGGTVAHDIKNSIAWLNPTEMNSDGAAGTGSNNTWNGVVSVGSNDFINLSSVGMNRPRGADGSLPLLNFAQLKQGSDLINAGVNVGFPYYNSLRKNTPDMGYKQINTVSELDFKR